MATRNILMLERTYHRVRDNFAWWKAVQNVNGDWQVHFHADYVPSTDWTCVDSELFSKIGAELTAWKLAVDQHWTGR